MAAYELDWSFGLISSAGKYLTAETFQNKIGATAGVMKKKQIWFLEATDGSDTVKIRSHLGKYLRVDGDGKFTGDGEQDNEETDLVIIALDDGRWNLKSNKYGWFAGGSGENLSAFTTEDTAEHNKWTVHLAMHPQVCIKNVKRKTYMHLSDDGNSLQCDEAIPWGFDATVTVIYFTGGTYGLQAANGHFLTNTGALVADADDNCKFIIAFLGKQMTFKSVVNGKYVTALGASGICKATKGVALKDETFVMEDSWPQITLKANNGKYVSIKQGVELAAKSAAVTDAEIFQVEPDSAGAWILKSVKDKLWTAVEANAVSTTTDATDLTADTAPEACKFTIEFLGDKVKISPAGKPAYAVQGSAYIKSIAGGPEGADEFTYEIINRPQLILRGEYGFVGVLPSGLLECNKSGATAFPMTVEDGFCKLAASNGKYWKVGDNGVSASSDAAESYVIELFPESKLALKSVEKGKYFQGAQNGAFTCTGTKIDASTLFEY
jgi:fascin 1/2